MKPGYEAFTISCSVFATECLLCVFFVAASMRARSQKQILTNFMLLLFYIYAVIANFLSLFLCVLLSSTFQ